MRENINGIIMSDSKSLININVNNTIKNNSTSDTIIAARMLIIL